MSLRLHTFLLPVLLVGTLQLGGCGRQTIDPPPPGGVYRSGSAGAHYDQAVQIKDQPGEYIANFPLGEIFRAPHNQSLILIAAGDKGIVRSTDDGQNWEVLTTPLAFVSDVVALPSGVMVAAATDGEGQGFVIRSLDDGASWNSVYTVPVPEEESQGIEIIGKTPPRKTEIVELEIDPFNADRIYAASTLGTVLVGEQSAKLWRSLYPFRSPGFDQLADQKTVGVRQMEASPHTAGEILIITQERHLLRLSPTGQQEIRVPEYINVPTPIFGGDEYKKVFDVAYIPGFPQALLIGVEDGVVVTRDNGQTWLQLPIPLENLQVFNTISVAASPTNTNRLLIGVNHVWYRSEDGGNTWSTFTLGLSTFNIQDISINADNASRVLTVMQPEEN